MYEYTPNLLFFSPCSQSISTSNFHQIHIHRENPLLSNEPKFSLISSASVSIMNTIYCNIVTFTWGSNILVDTIYGSPTLIHYKSKYQIPYPYIGKGIFQYIYVWYIGSWKCWLLSIWILKAQMFIIYFSTTITITI